MHMYTRVHACMRAHTEAHTCTRAHTHAHKDADADTAHIHKTCWYATKASGVLGRPAAALRRRRCHATSHATHTHTHRHKATDADADADADTHTTAHPKDAGVALDVGVRIPDVAVGVCIPKAGPGAGKLMPELCPGACTPKVLELWSDPQCFSGTAPPVAA